MIKMPISVQSRNIENTAYDSTSNIIGVQKQGISANS